MEAQWGMAPVAPPPPAYEPATDPMYAPAPELSYQAPYVPPAPDMGYGADSSTYAPAPELSYQQPYVEPVPAYSDPMQDPWAAMAYAPAEQMAPTYESLSLDPSVGQQFGWDQGYTPPAPETPFFQNPQFAESNAQFDATTDPNNPNRYGPGIAGFGNLFTVDPQDKANALGAAGWVNNQISGLAEGYNGPGASVAQRGANIAGDVAGKAVEFTYPQSFADLGMLALPGGLPLGPGAADDAIRTATRGYGGRLLGTNLDTVLGGGSKVLDELPLEAARGALTRASENPALAPDFTDLVSPRRVFPTAGAADDVSPEDAAKAWADLTPSAPETPLSPFAEAKKNLFDEFKGMNKGEIREALTKRGFADDIVENKNKTINLDKTYDAVARKVAGAGPTPAAEDAAGLAARTPEQIAETVGKIDPAPGEKFPTGTVRSAGNDPVDVAEAEFAKTYGRSPSNEAANYVSDAPLSGQQAGLPLDGVKAADPRGFWDKFVDEAAAAASLPRSILASFDLSAPGRQGLALAFRHPKEWAESWAPMMKAWRTEAGAEAMGRELASINARIKSMVGTQDDMIHLYEVGADAKGLNKVPGFEGIGKGKISGAIGKADDALGNPLGRSERAYATFLNYQKSKTFETMATAMHKAGERNLDAYKRLGEVIDHATGFGAAPLTGRLEGQAFFSQRYMTSRFQFLTDPIVEALIKRDMKAAQAATENLVAFAGGLGGILALIDATGAANVEWDPRSTDFGKIRIGPQRIDFGAGFLPLIRTLSREVTGEAKASTGAVYDTSRIKEPLKFLRNKLAPIPSEVISRILGEDPVGNPNPPLLSVNTVANMFAPLIAQSTVEAFKQTGSPVMAARAGASELFGGGTSTYGTGQAQQINYAQSVYGKEYDSLASTQQASLNAYIVEQGADLPYRNRQAPWWQARDDALTDWAASIDPKTLEDPFSQKALSIKDSGYVDLQPELVTWARETYSLPRDEAETAVEKFLTSTGLDDQVKKYREYVLEQDPGFAKSWLDAYNGYEKDVYEPPKWIKDIAKGK